MEYSKPAYNGSNGDSLQDGSGYSAENQESSNNPLGSKGFGESDDFATDIDTTVDLTFNNEDSNVDANSNVANGTSAVPEATPAPSSNAKKTDDKKKNKKKGLGGLFGRKKK
ncbi:unnamed protein product [[Candida] boidinii]|nr:unnamed protein product [[Candida] boidinii]